MIRIYMQRNSKIDKKNLKKGSFFFFVFCDFHDFSATHIIALLSFLMISRSDISTVFVKNVQNSINITLIHKVFVHKKYDYCVSIPSTKHTTMAKNTKNYNYYSNSAKYLSHKKLILYFFNICLEMIEHIKWFKTTIFSSNCAFQEVFKVNFCNIYSL